MRPAMLAELLEAANAQGLVAADVRSITMIRGMFAHGSDTVLNAPMFLEPFQYVTAMIAELFDPAKASRVP
jgi:hypothetical protein